MKYEFHVGDYVETVEGITGYVTRSELIRVDGVPRLYDLQVTLPDFVHPITYSMHDDGVSDFLCVSVSMNLLRAIERSHRSTNSRTPCCGQQH